MLITVLHAANWLAAILIFILGLFYAINNMSGETIHCMRYAWIAMTTGALAILLGPLFGFGPPSFSQTLLNVGVAVFLVVDRSRRRFLR